MKLFSLILYLHLVWSTSADYVWENGNWVWKEAGPGAIDTNIEDEVEKEGSGDDYYDSEWDDYGSGEDDYVGGRDSYDYEDNYDNYNNDNNNNNNNFNHDNSNKQWPENNYDKTNVHTNLDNAGDIDFSENLPSPTTPPPMVVPTTPKVVQSTRGTVENSNLHPTSFFAQPGILAAVVGGAVVGLLCAILLVMFIVYRMRKKDEGSYALDEPRRSPNVHLYSKAPNREFFA